MRHNISKIICSIILQQTAVRNTSLWFALLALLPFSNKWVMNASLQSAGSQPLGRLRVNTDFNKGIISTTVLISIIEDIPSGPTALLVLSLHMIRFLLLLEALRQNTDLKSFGRVFTFPRVSEITLSIIFNWMIPHQPCLYFLIYLLNNVLHSGLSVLL